METNNYDKKSEGNFDPSYFESEEFKERQRRMNEEFDRSFKEKDEMEHKKNMALLWLTIVTISCFIGIILAFKDSKLYWLSDMICCGIVFLIARKIYQGIYSDK